MAITLIATAGSATANSLATEAAFIALMATRLNVPTGTTVEGSDCSETEKKALIEATRELDLITWKGTRVDSTQALSWPRDYVEDPDLPWASVEAADTYYFATTIIPDRISEACIELAMEFIKAGTTDLAKRDASVDIKRKKTDVLEKEWFDRPGGFAEGLDRFPRILNLIAPLMNVESGVMNLIRM